MTSPPLTVSLTVKYPFFDAFPNLFGSVCVAVASALVNATAVIVIKKKEQSGLNRCRASANNVVNRIKTMLRLIVVDCYANIVTALVQLLAHLPSSWSRCTCAKK